LLSQQHTASGMHTLNLPSQWAARSTPAGHAQASTCPCCGHRHAQIARAKPSSTHKQLPDEDLMLREGCTCQQPGSCTRVHRCSIASLPACPFQEAGCPCWGGHVNRISSTAPSSKCRQLPGKALQTNNLPAGSGGGSLPHQPLQQPAASVFTESGTTCCETSLQLLLLLLRLLFGVPKCPSSCTPGTLPPLPLPSTT
jgi:hypothetical protein